MRDDQLWPLALVFLSFSLSSVGGGPSLFAPMHHQSVDVHHWITDREFINLFAISRAAPGPGSMLATLIGWKAGGWLGALVASLALFIPSSVVLYVVAKIWERYRGRRWHSALQEGLAPIGTGLILAGAVRVSHVMGAGPLTWVVAVGSAVVLAQTRLHPLFLLALGGAIFIALA